MKRLTLLLVILLAINVQAQTTTYPPITPENIDSLGVFETFGVGLIYDVAWSPDGGTIAALSQTGIWLYDAYDPDELPIPLLEEYFELWSRIWYTLDGSKLIARQGKQLYIWPANEPLNNEPEIIDRYGTISRDATRSATTSETEDQFIIKIWDISNPDTPVGILDGHTNRIRTLALNTDGTLAASYSIDGTLRMWNLTTMQQISYHQIHEPVTDGILATLFDMAISPNNLLVFDNDIYDLETGEYLAELRFMPTRSRLFFSVDGTKIFATNGLEGGYGLWDISQARSGEVEVIRAVISETHSSTDLYWVGAAFSPNGEYLVRGGEGLIETADIMEDLSMQFRGTPRRAGTGELFISYDERWLLHEQRYTTLVLDLQTGSSHILNNLYLQDFEPYAFTPSGAFIWGNDEGYIFLWDIASDTLLGDFQSEVGTLNRTITFSSDGSLFATATSNDEVIIWNTEDFTQLAILEYDGNNSTMITFAENNTLLMAYTNKFAVYEPGEPTAVYMWDVDEALEIEYVSIEDATDVLGTTIPAEQTYHLALDIFDNDWLVIPTRPELYRYGLSVWNLAEHNPDPLFLNTGNTVEGLDFSPDGRLLAATARTNGSRVRKLRLYEVETWDHIRTYGDAEFVYFSPSGQYLFAVAPSALVTVYAVTEEAE